MYDNTRNRREYGAFSRWLGRNALRLMGMKAVGTAPDVKKYILTAAPHTTNWDLLMMLLLTRALGIPGVFIMKDTVFWWPLGALWRWLGGIPVNRRAARHVVGHVETMFKESESLRLVITPEGTRKAVEHWKLGFYWMALRAEVPVLLGFVDYKNRETGVGPLVHLTGDIETDFEQFRAFYEPRAGVVPKYKLRKGEMERMLGEAAPNPQSPEEKTES